LDAYNQAKTASGFYMIPLNFELNDQANIQHYFGTPMEEIDI